MRAAAAVVAVLALAPAASAKTYRQADSGRSVAIDRGDTFVVKLKQSSDGGYLWRYKAKPDGAVLKRVKKKQTSSCDGKDYCVGGFTTILWTFKAVGTGRTKVNLVEKRSFEKTSIKRFKLRVRVR